MSDYERARLLGTRAINIHHGMPPLVRIKAGDHPIDIARREIEQKVLPAVVRRHFPGGTYEDWAVRHLVVVK
jgi:DNA-directed RNA polymerase I, II, and III subunit RPABC2